MSDRFPFIQNHDIVPAWEPQLKNGAAASDTSIVITLKNADHVAFLLSIGAIIDGYTGRLRFYSCSGVDGSDATLIEPIYFREKVNDGSDTWGAVTAITDGVFDINTGDKHINDSDSNDTLLFEFEGAEIWQEGVDAADAVRNRDCIKAVLATTNADGSDLNFSGHWILWPLSYSNPASSSFDNRTD